MKEQTYAIVGTLKSSGIRQVIIGGFYSKTIASKRLEIEKKDRFMKQLYRYMRVAKEDYHPRMEGAVGHKIIKK